MADVFDNAGGPDGTEANHCEVLMPGCGRWLDLFRLPTLKLSSKQQHRFETHSLAFRFPRRSDRGHMGGQSVAKRHGFVAGRIIFRADKR
jgi:hypothetical protein